MLLVRLLNLEPQSKGDMISQKLSESQGIAIDDLSINFQTSDFMIQQFKWNAPKLRKSQYLHGEE